MGESVAETATKAKSKCCPEARYEVAVSPLVHGRLWMSIARESEIM